MLLKLPDILSPKELELARQLLAGAPWEDGGRSAGPQARGVKNNQQLPHDCEAAATVRRMVLSGLERNPRFMSAALPLKVLPPRINRYAGDTNHYGPHVDNAIRLLPDSQRLRTDVSCTVFLSDPADYDGGELAICDTFGQHTVKLPAGHAVLYPGTSVHQVAPVTRGERLACFFWVQSLVPRDEHRRLLFDLDMNLLSLRERHGESAETTALTGVYHNLIRLWSQT